MRLKELLKTLPENEFIAVGFEGEEVRYSGSAGRYSWYVKDAEVKEVIPPRNQYSARIIRLKK